MAGTRLREVFRESLGNMWREVRIALTPLPRPKKWLFLVGCYNSGTTLLAELLSRHPEVISLPTEGHFITDQFVKDYAIGVPRMWVERESIFRMDENDSGPDPIRIKKEWGMRASGKGDVFIEKSPPNSARTRWLQAHFQEAYFVALVRNGYAVAEGITRKGDPKHFDEGWPIEMSARQWAYGNDVLLEDAEHLKRFMWLKYEDLCADPAKALSDIASFVGLERTEGIYTPGSFAIHERNEGVKNMNSVSLERLTPEQIEAINRVAGHSLKHFGYEILSEDV
ncbi:MAG: sulfotransferase [Pseudomonadota bacterium]